MVDTGAVIGIVIGVVITILIGVIVSGGISTSNQSNPIADIIETDDVHLASIEAFYHESSDRLVVALILTNKDAEYTKANGNLKLRVTHENEVRVYSNEYDFTKDDFFSWKTNSGEKITGYRIDIDKHFLTGSHDVYADFTTKSDKTWNHLHASFYSID